MRQKRFSLIFLALFLACVPALVLAAAVPAGTQAVVNNSRGTGSPPVTFILDSMLNAHEQDIKEKMFENQFEAASNDPAAQVVLVNKRGAELKKATATKKSILKGLLAMNGAVSDSQFVALTDEVGGSIEMLNGRSKKLEEHAAGLVLLNGHKAYTDSVEPLISDVSDARELASKASQVAKDKKNANAGKK